MNRFGKIKGSGKGGVAAVDSEESSLTKKRKDDNELDSGDVRKRGQKKIEEKSRMEDSTTEQKEEEINWEEIYTFEARSMT